jgi:P-type Cu+ transporter
MKSMDEPNQVKDPVCGMQFAPEKAAGTYEYKDQIFYFCNPSCLEKFRTDPEKFLGAAKPSSEPPC